MMINIITCHIVTAITSTDVFNVITIIIAAWLVLGPTR